MSDKLQEILSTIVYLAGICPFNRRKPRHMKRKKKPKRSTDTKDRRGKGQKAALGKKRVFSTHRAYSHYADILSTSIQLDILFTVYDTEYK